MKQLSGLIGISAVALLFMLSEPKCSAIVINNEYWVGPTTNGLNLGTLNDPYWGATQNQFESVMYYLPTNSVIHILPGTYQTSGNCCWVMKTGQRVLGSGIDVTTIRLNSAATDQTVAIASQSGSNMEVADLTIDCNTQAGAVTLDGIMLVGTRVAIRRVKCINARANSPNNYECFPISILGSGAGVNQNSDGNIIEECEVSQFQGTGPCSAIALNSGSVTNWISGVVRNNRVFLPVTTDVQHCYNLGEANNVLVEGNYSSGGLNGFYEDSGPYTNVVIAHNFFKNCFTGVFLYPQSTPLDNYSILFNKIELSTNYSAAGAHGGIVLSQSTTNGTLRNVAIIGNSIRFIGGTTPPTGVIGYGIYSTADSACTILNNTLDANFLYSFSSAANSIFDNFDFGGNFGTGSLNQLNQIAPPNGWTRRTVTNNTTLVYSDYYIGVAPNSSTTVTNTLPPATGHSGKAFMVGDEAGFAATKNIYIIPTSPDKINGSTSPVKITTPYGSLTVMSDGTNWFAH